MNTKLVFLFLALGVAPFAWPPVSSAQIDVIPGSSTRGAEVFREKTCVQCHASGGVGPNITPALIRSDGRGRTPMQLASALWNHAPRMWRAQEEKGIRPTLDSLETADLFAYFYSLSYFSAPGNAMKGATVFEEKQCASCHELTASKPRERLQKLMGPPISTWSNAEDPLAWAEHMWNHAGKVSAQLSRVGISWPRFSPQEMVDLLAYIHSLPQARSHSAEFQPGNPEQGLTIFERSCETCHTFGGRTADPKIDLLKRPAPDGLTGYVAAMWNHAPTMHLRAGQQFPVLGPGDMSNLVAYLFAQRYFYEEGNAQRGALVFQAKNCIVCHEQRRKQTGASDLTLSTERYSPITMSAAIWRHGPAMLQKTKKENIDWPELSPAEMKDLITYLNSRLVTRIGESTVNNDKLSQR